MLFNFQTKSNKTIAEPAATEENSSGSSTPKLLRVNELVQDEGQKHLDNLLAKELNQLSLGEREQIYEEIHGVNQVVEESPAFVNEKLFTFGSSSAKDILQACIRSGLLPGFSLLYESKIAFGIPSSGVF